jgi:16S rRNA processing protein RimM
MESSELCLIGKIVGPHGIAGGMRVQSYSDVPGRFESLKSVLVQNGSGAAVRYTIAKAAVTGAKVVVFFEGISTRDKAEMMRGADLLIEADEMAPPPSGKYYVHELIGCTVVTEDKQHIGVVKDVMLLPANDIYVVDAGGREVLVPAVPDFVSAVDIKARCVTIKLVDGLMGEEA